MSFSTKPLLITCLLFIGVSWQASAQVTDTALVIASYTDATFPGGDRAYSAYWKKSFRPKKYKFSGQGRVSYTVTTDGTISDIQIVESLSPEMDQAAITAIREMPRWQPATKNGRPIASRQSTTYWSSKRNIWTGQDSGIEPPPAQSLRNHGWLLGLGFGMLHRTGSFHRYMQPNRFSMYLGCGYFIKRFQLQFEYDIIAAAKLKQALQVDGATFTGSTNERFHSLNLYFPVAYTVYKTARWRFSPFIAPTLNTFGINQRAQSEQLSKFTDFNFTLGAYSDYVIDYSGSYTGRRNKHVALLTNLRSRIFINPIHIMRPNSTTLHGAALGFSVGLHFSSASRN